MLHISLRRTIPNADAQPGDNVLTAPSKKRYMQSSANAGCLMTCWGETETNNIRTDDNIKVIANEFGPTWSHSVSAFGQKEMQKEMQKASKYSQKKQVGSAS